MIKKSNKVPEKGRKKAFKSSGAKRMKRILFGIGVLILAAGAGSAAFFLTVRKENGGNESAVRRNVQTAVSDTVTEEGSVSVGTVSQTFDLDLSEFSGSTSFSWSSGGMGGDMGGDMRFNIVAGSASSGTRELAVEEVYVKVGEEVAAGDPILKVTADTLESIRNGFAEDVTDAKAVYDQTLAQQKQTENEAAAALKENQMYGAYADTEYNLAVAGLQETVEELLASIAEAEESMAGDQEELAALRETVEEQKSVLENAVYVVENEDRVTNTYSWLTAVNARVDIETTIGNLEAEIETLEDSVADQEETLLSLNAQLVSAQKALEEGTIEAEIQRQTRLLKLESAQEIYDVTTQLAEFETENAKEDYEEAVARLAELDTYIVDQIIYAQQDGVITQVSVSAGDTLRQDMELIALNSYDDVTITLTLDEDDMDAAALESSAEVTFSAYPDEIFAGEVTEIGDAQIDSNTNTTTYQVVVTILENASRLYEGMSAEVTFTRPQTGAGRRGAEKGAGGGEMPEDAAPGGEAPDGEMPDGAAFGRDAANDMQEGSGHEAE